jgi:hypothetical protein
MASAFEKLSTIVERSKKHEGGHALVYHLMGKEVVDWNINTYQGCDRDSMKFVLASPYAQPAFVHYQGSKDSYDDGDILGSLAGLAAEDNDEQFRIHLKQNIDWNDLHDVYRETKRRLREALGRPVFPCEVRVVIGKIYKKLAYALRQPNFQLSFIKIGELLEEESSQRKVADPSTGWLEERQGASVSTNIEQILQSEFDPPVLDDMKARLSDIRVDRVIDAYRRLRKNKYFYNLPAEDLGREPGGEGARP